MKKTICLTLLMLSIFSCFRKKTPPKNIESWLEVNFPGQFNVLHSNLKILDIMAQFKGDKESLIAENADPDVQFLLYWNKKTEGLGIYPDQLKEAQARAKAYVAEARKLYPMLQAEGLEKMAVGVVKGDVYVQVFEEPTPECRAKTVASVSAAIKKRAAESNPTVHLSIMEPDAYQAKFKEIIPLGYFVTETGWQKEKEILQVDLDPDSDKPQTVHWDVNPVSKRGSQYSTEALELASTWAEKNLKKPYFLVEDHPTGFEVLKPKKTNGRDGGPAIRLAFPYFVQKPSVDTEPEGYITVVYLFDKQVFEQPKLEKEY